jgi:hypothetical protein
MNPETEQPRAAIACSSGTISLQRLVDGRVQMQVFRYDGATTSFVIMTPAEVQDLMHVLEIVR